MYCSLLLAVFIQYVQAEIFTSMADMEQMVLSEKHMLTALKDYILAEEQKLDEVKKFMSRVNEALQYVNKSDVGKYLGNPVNSYLMLKRFNVDWKQLEKTLETDFAEGFNNVFENMKPYFPTAEDHEGAMDALFRLQTTYKLKSESLAKGVIPGVTQISTHPLNIQEIYELGRHAYNKKNWQFASQWLSVALEEMGDQDVYNTIYKADIMDYLAYSLFQLGEVRKAFELTKKLALLIPEETRILDNLAYFKRELRSLEAGKRGELGDDENPDPEPEEEVEEQNVVYTNSGKAVDSREVAMKNYEKLCRGEVRDLTKKEQRRMVCWYKTKNPRLRLKPQKVERLWVSPEIFLFRDIIDDRQSNWIKKTSHPMLQRAVIQDPITDELKVADYRISKSAWLSAEMYPEVKQLRDKATAVTGLDMAYAEHLQIANYGIGGHYEPHFDHARDDEDKFTDLNMGNRIATLLFYISDVKAGGPTVFTRAQTAVYPSKNDAVFWFNLKRNGEGNELTRHAACPVLVGQKWVSNWWIHEYGQFLRRKCALNKDW